MSSVAVQKVSVPSDGHHGRIVATLIYCYPIVLLWLFGSCSRIPGDLPAAVAVAGENRTVELWKFAISGDLMFHGSDHVAARADWVFRRASWSACSSARCWAARAFSIVCSSRSSCSAIRYRRSRSIRCSSSSSGFGDMSKIVLVFLECLYPITLQTVFGMRSAERALVWAAQNAGASRSQTVLAGAGAVGRACDLRRHPDCAAGLADRHDHHRNHRREPRPRLRGCVRLGLVRAGARHGGLRVIAAIGFIFDRTFVGLRRRLIYWQKDSAGTAMKSSDDRA